jgi:hypothetical protein
MMISNTKQEAERLYLENLPKARAEILPKQMPQKVLPQCALDALKLYGKFHPDVVINYPTERLFWCNLCQVEVSDCLHRKMARKLGLREI